MGEHLLNDLVISLSKSFQTKVPEAPQAFKTYGFAKGIHRFSCFHGVSQFMEIIECL